MDIKKFQTIAPELNYLLTEPPKLEADGEYDLGWYCREHAFCIAVVGALLGFDFKIVRGDFLIRTASGFRLGSIGASHDHAWCQADAIPVIDFSLHFRLFPPGPQIAEPIIRLGRNGSFDVRILPQATKPFVDFGEDAVIGYIARQVFHKSARDWLSSPLPFLVHTEAVLISKRIALHLFHLVTGKSGALAGTMPQREALAYLRRKHNDAHDELYGLFENAT
jgi:hypothetical protein